MAFIQVDVRKRDRDQDQSGNAKGSFVHGVDFFVWLPLPLPRRTSSPSLKGAKTTSVLSSKGGMPSPPHGDATRRCGMQHLASLRVHFEGWHLSFAGVHFAMHFERKQTPASRHDHVISPRTKGSGFSKRKKENHTSCLLLVCKLSGVILV